MTHIIDTFRPIKENVDLYEKLYGQVYLKMYQQLKPIYKQIKKNYGLPTIIINNK